LKDIIPPLRRLPAALVAPQPSSIQWTEYDSNVLASEINEFTLGSEMEDNIHTRSRGLAIGGLRPLGRRQRLPYIAANRKPSLFDEPLRG
jgi:hypothetical protein